MQLFRNRKGGVAAASRVLEDRRDGDVARVPMKKRSAESFQGGVVKKPEAVWTNSAEEQWAFEEEEEAPFAAKGDEGGLMETEEGDDNGEDRMEDDDEEDMQQGLAGKQSSRGTGQDYSQQQQETWSQPSAPAVSFMGVLGQQHEDQKVRDRILEIERKIGTALEEMVSGTGTRESADRNAAAIIDALNLDGCLDTKSQFTTDKLKRHMLNIMVALKGLIEARQSTIGGSRDISDLASKLVGDIVVGCTPREVNVRYMLARAEEAIKDERLTKDVASHQAFSTSKPDSQHQAEAEYLLNVLACRELLEAFRDSFSLPRDQICKCKERHMETLQTLQTAVDTDETRIKAKRQDILVRARVAAKEVADLDRDSASEIKQAMSTDKTMNLAATTEIEKIIGATTAFLSTEKGAVIMHRRSILKDTADDEALQLQVASAEEKLLSTVATFSRCMTQASAAWVTGSCERMDKLVAQAKVDCMKHLREMVQRLATTLEGAVRHNEKLRCQWREAMKATSSANTTTLDSANAYLKDLERTVAASEEADKSYVTKHLLGFWNESESVLMDQGDRGTLYEVFHGKLGARGKKLLQDHGKPVTAPTGTLGEAAVAASTALKMETDVAGQKLDQQQGAGACLIS